VRKAVVVGWYCASCLRGCVYWGVVRDLKPQSLINRIEPNSWQDLQTSVAEILSNCGFRTEVEKTVETARGTVELDVYADEEIKGRKYSIVCECKFWKSQIPQTVVHGFRTVLNDLGCNMGYVITSSAFQKGALKTAEFTNIELLTWHEFQEKFFETWFEDYFVVRLTKELDPLMTYTEPIFPRWFDSMSDEDQDRYIMLRERYFQRALSV
jgi:restriction system protein